MNQIETAYQKIDRQLRATIDDSDADQLITIFHDPRMTGVDYVRNAHGWMRATWPDTELRLQIIALAAAVMPLTNQVRASAIAQLVKSNIYLLGKESRDHKAGVAGCLTRGPLPVTDALHFACAQVPQQDIRYMPVDTACFDHVQALVQDDRLSLPERRETDRVIADYVCRRGLQLATGSAVIAIDGKTKAWNELRSLSARRWAQMAVAAPSLLPRRDNVIYPAFGTARKDTQPGF